MRALLLVVILAVLAALYFSLGSATTTTASLGQVSSGDADAATKTATTKGLDASVREADAKTVRESVDSPAEKAGETLLRGVFVAMDSKGVAHSQETGQFELHVLEESVSVEVTKGRWELRVPAKVVGDLILFSDATLDGRPLMSMDGGRTVEAGEDGEARVEFRAPWVYPARLRVQDRKTRRDLRGITVALIRSRPGANEYEVHPDTIPPLLTDAASPLVIEPDEFARFYGEGALWIHAPGCAWKRVSVSHRVEKERVVLLSSGGDLRVTLGGEPLPKATAVRVLRVRSQPPQGDVAKLDAATLELEYEPEAERPGDAAHTYLFPGLRPSVYVVQVRRSGREPEVLGSAVVRVEAGRRADTHILVRKPESREPVTVAGVLKLPAPWPREGVHLHIEPFGDAKRWVAKTVVIPLTGMRPLAGGDAYRFQTKKLVPGYYEARVEPAGFRQRVDVSKNGEAGLVLDVPLPAEVRVRILDTESGGPVPDARLTWNQKLPKGVERFRPGLSEKIEDGSLRFIAPVGQVVLYAAGPEYAGASSKFEVKAGRNDHVIRIGRVCGVAISLAVGEAEVPWDGDYVYNLESVGHEGKMSFWVGAKGAANLPGKYRLTFEPMKGFEPVPPRIVVLKRGEYLPVKVQLQHSKSP